MIYLLSCLFLQAVGWQTDLRHVESLLERLLCFPQDRRRIRCHWILPFCCVLASCREQVVVWWSLLHDWRSCETVHEDSWPLSSILYRFRDLLPLYSAPAQGMAGDFCFMHWIFLLNIPIGLIGILWSCASCLISRGHDASLTGLAFCCLGVVSFLWDLSFWGMKWHPAIWFRVFYLAFFSCFWV